MFGGLFNHRFPYTNFHEINLDWIINEIIALKNGEQSQDSNNSSDNDDSSEETQDDT